MNLFRGMSQRELDDLWLENGGTIVDVRRTGERRYVHPAKRKRSAAYNRRRKDAPVRLVTFVRQVLEGES